MTTLTHKWSEPAPRRDAISRLRLDEPDSWQARLLADRDRAARHQTPELASITDTIARRSRGVGAEALILTGSTARGRRTAVSDLDYHVIGPRPQITDLHEEIDLYADDRESLFGKLHAGDDFVHWSLWYGCVLFDSGVIKDAAEYVLEHALWPDPERKRRQSLGALDFAARMVDSGDHPRALEEARGALSMTARWWLLSHDVFPLARDELAEQLADLGQLELAASVEATINGRPTLAALRHAIASAWRLTAKPDSGARRPQRSRRTTIESSSAG